MIHPAIPRLKRNAEQIDYFGTTLLRHDDGNFRRCLLVAMAIFLRTLKVKHVKTCFKNTYRIKIQKYHVLLINGACNSQKLNEHVLTTG